MASLPSSTNAAITSASTSTNPLPYKTTFIESCLRGNVITFGNYTLKSGRQSPYFFNAGLFHRGDLYRTITTAFAHSILDYMSVHPHRLKDIDVLFGPAFKGIALAAGTVDKLTGLAPERFEGLSWSFNRKEVKDHGEGGRIVGCPLKGKRVLVVDDVITAGTAVGEAADIIQREGGILVGIIVALDRMERMPAEESGEKRISAIAEVERRYGVPVITIVTLDDLIAHLKQGQSEEDVRRIEEYRSQYGVSG